MASQPEARDPGPAGSPHSEDSLRRPLLVTACTDAASVLLILGAALVVLGITLLLLGIMDGGLVLVGTITMVLGLFNLLVRRVTSHAGR